MDIKYCKFCGCRLKGNEKFCMQCGRLIREHSHKAGFQEEKTYSEYRNHMQHEPIEKLACELAYFGFLFWLPLLFGKKEEETKKIANQGLWALIMGFVACTCLRVFEGMNLFFKGTLLFPFTNSFYGFVFIIFLGFMLMLVYKCICNVKAIHRDIPIENIFFFDNIKIIH